MNNLGGPQVLRVAGFLDNSAVNGEGMRSVVFLAGCKHKCKGCQNAHIQSPTSGSDATIDEIMERVKRNKPFIKGVTISGGEPFDQNFIELVKQIKAEGLNVWVYTGYTYEQLLLDSRKYIKPILKYIDTIVDGKYIESLSVGAPKYAGSTNQRFIHLNEGKVQRVAETA